MPDYDFSQVDAAIVDTQPNSLRLMRDVLGRLGIKKIETLSSFKEAAVRLTGGTPDLVLIDADGEEAEAEAFKLVRTVRNDANTPNPFAGLIVTTWQPTPVLLMRVTNSGADDLLVKPVSPKQVLDRIGTLIRERKGFVVTADYTGPDRRKSPREGAQIPLLDVPNTLKLKAMGRWDTGHVRQLMATAVRQVSEQKVLRSAVQAAFLVEFARTGLLAAPPDRMALDHLARVPAVVDELVRRLPDDRDTTAAKAAARALRQLAELIRAKAEAGTVDGGGVERTVILSHELLQASDPDRPLDAMVREVEAAVAGYRSRLEQLAQAKAAEAAKAAAEGGEEAKAS
ncbi:response regulator [Azospirillum sp. TSO22-1]|uniref:response regulator n=1 Tax=Azospirillum sp. TSO22-1 TaxID=716789 RepID=UPI000D611966|nr:response regulator [Azospirillum sp. TSO22-1]PWC57001.1 regulator [Azospirillum sp. TSO22-1]